MTKNPTTPNSPETLPITAWLPTTLKEAKKRGWEELDVVLVTGDAYVDHPPSVQLLWEESLNH